MKKQIFRLALLAAMIAAPTCTEAQSVSSVLNSLKNKASSSSSSSSSSDDSSSSSTTSSIISTITSIFSSSKRATASKIVGTWTYSEPAIVFESENVLSKVGSQAAASKIESTLQTQLEKYGIKEGAVTLTFAEDGTFTETLNGKTTSGTWEIDDDALKLTFSGKATISVATQVSSSKLQLVTDASGLLSLAKAMASSSSNSSLSTISSLMSSVDGMQVGLTFVK